MPAPISSPRSSVALWSGSRKSIVHPGRAGFSYASSDSPARRVAGADCRAGLPTRASIAPAHVFPARLLRSLFASVAVSCIRCKSVLAMGGSSRRGRGVLQSQALTKLLGAWPHKLKLRIAWKALVRCSVKSGRGAECSATAGSTLYGGGWYLVLDVFNRKRVIRLPSWNCAPPGHVGFLKAPDHHLGRQSKPATKHGPSVPSKI